MPVDYRGVRYDVVGGVAQLCTPSLDGDQISPISRENLDRRIARITTNKDRLISRRDELQARIDELSQAETDLTTLRASATADPP